MATQPGGDYQYDGGNSGKPVVLPVVVASQEQGKILDSFFQSTLGSSTVTQTTQANGTVVLKGSNGETVKIFSNENKGKIVKGILTKNDAAVIGTDKASKVDAGAGANQVVLQGTGHSVINVANGNDKVTLATDGPGSATISLGGGKDTVVIGNQFQGNATIKDFSKKDQMQILDRSKDGKVTKGEDYVISKKGKDTVLVLLKDGKETSKITLKNVNSNKVQVSDDGILTIS